MEVFIHVCKKDEYLFNKWLKFTRSLGDLPEMIVWAEDDVNLDCKIDKFFKSKYPYPTACSYVWYEAITTINKPVLYLEPDAWVCDKNWYEMLKKEYNSYGCPGALVTSSENPPHDMVGGIGIYDASKLPLPSFDDLLKQIPENAAFDLWIGVGIEKIGWDGRIINHIKPLVSFTSLIQHSYGDYSRGCQPHMFPRDNRMIRSNSVIFHRDKFQGLIV